MIISIDEAKGLVNFPEGWTDDKIKMKLLAAEQTIRAYTNNNFQKRELRVAAFISGGILVAETVPPFSVGDTVQISESRYNDGLFSVFNVSGQTIMVNEQLSDEENVLVTKVVYPADVVACCVNLLEWEVSNRAKVGVQSETLSRHSVTYFNMDGANNVMGYPASLLGCLKPYRKARC